MDRQRLGARAQARRLFLKSSAVLALSAAGFRNARAQDASWQLFKQRFVVDGRRVIDTGNNNVTHTESQGWGMLFAEGNDDRVTFRSLWDWTYSSLKRRDGLFSWRWSPAAPDPVADKNNATDGDLLIAWALARASRRWREPEWMRQSLAIQDAIMGKLAVEVAGRVVLLPGVDGFRRKDSVVVNLSYYVWPAIREFAEADRRGRWRQLETDGLWLLDNAAFGTYRLPPDWLLFGNHEVKIAEGWPPYFGFDAIRIPLYLAWSNDVGRLTRFLSMWQTPRFAGQPPAWINLQDGSVAPYPAPAGYRAVVALAQFAAGGPPLGAASDLLETDNYYSASLKLLCNLATRERPQGAR
jgi:endoglucanase